MPQYRFGDFRVDTDTVEVWGPDGIRDVEPQVFGVLQYFVEQGDRLVTRTSCSRTSGATSSSPSPR